MNLRRGLFLLVCLPLAAQDIAPTRPGQPPGAGRAADPYVVYDTRPVILHGPYLIAPAETSVVVAWGTDKPSHPKVLYVVDAPTQESVTAKCGVVAVGTVHGADRRVEAGTDVSLQGAFDARAEDERILAGQRTVSGDRGSQLHDAEREQAGNAARIEALAKPMYWKTADFLVHTGDAFRHRGERGSGLRAMAVSDLEGARIDQADDYYARDDGPVHLLAIDTGEDKPDSTNVYARLNDFASYRRQQLAWLEAHARTSLRMAAAPFRVAVMHQPFWEYVDGVRSRGPRGRIRQGSIW